MSDIHVVKRGFHTAGLLGFFVSLSGDQNNISLRSEIHCMPDGCFTIRDAIVGFAAKSFFDLVQNGLRVFASWIVRSQDYMG